MRLLLIFTFILLLAGCYNAPTPPVSYRPAGQSQTASTPATACVRRNLGQMPVYSPQRPVRALITEASDSVDRLAELAFGAATLPNSVETVILLLEGDVQARQSSADLPSEDAIETDAGAVPLPAQLVKELCSEAQCARRRSFARAELRSAREAALVMNMKFGTVHVLPIVLNGRGVSRKLCGVLLKELFNGHSVLVCMLPAGYGQRKPEWRRLMSGVMTEGWKGQKVPLTALAALELSRQLSLTPFELTRKATVRDDAPDDARRELALLALLESRNSRDIMNYGMERNGEVADEDVVKDIASMRDLVSGQKQREMLNEAEQKVLLALTRAALTRGIGGKPFELHDLPQYSKRFMEPLGCRIALYLDGKLYNSTYSLGTDQPLLKLMLMQCGKLLKDPRHPLEPETFGKMLIEISLFTEPFPLTFKRPEQLLAQIRPGRHGVILKAGGKSSGFLPDMWKTYETPEKLLEELCRRCGQPPENLWNGEAKLLVFDEQVCRESGVRK